MFNLKINTVLFVLCATSSFCDDKVVQINLKKSLNVINNNYISFSIDDYRLQFAKMPIENQEFSSRLKKLSPALVRTPLTRIFFPLNETTNNDLNENDLDFNVADWKKYYDWLVSIGMTPIFSIPYYPKMWKPKNVLNILGTAFNLGITDCIWQLGIDFHGTSAEQYADDLHTFQTMIYSFPSHKTNWTIVTAEIAFGSDPNEINKFIDLVEEWVEAIGWIEPTEINSDENVLNADTSLQNIRNSELPIWVTMETIPTIPNEIKQCDNTCITSGLNWAKSLGYAGKIGFSAVFKNLEIDEILQSRLPYFVSLIYKKTVGNKMFETRTKQTERTKSKFYSFCSKNYPGAITIMGINFDDTKCNIIPKLGNRYYANEIYQYILNVQNDLVHLNNDPIFGNETTLRPYIKSKRGNLDVILNLPPKSVGFWELGYGNCRECLLDNGNDVRNLIKNKNIPTRTSVDLLVQDLIWKTLNNSEGKMVSRSRRSVFNKSEIKSKKGQNKKKFSIKYKKNGRNRRFILSPDVIVDLKTDGLSDVDKKLWKNSILIRRKKDNAIRKLGRKRNKRQITFPKLDLTKLSLLPVRETKPLSILAPKQNSAEKVFVTRDDPNIPTGDVVFEVGAGNSDHDVATDYDYVEFNEDGMKNTKQISEVKQYEDASDVDMNYAYVPNEFYEQLEKKFPKYDEHQVCENCQELWEGDTMMPYYEDNQQNPGNYYVPDVENEANLNYIVRELEPTHQQNQENLKKSTSMMRSFYADPIQQNSAEFLPFGIKKYEDEDEDDESFFRRKESRRKSFNPFKRPRRSIDNGSNRSKSQNQILNAVEEIVDSLEKDGINVNNLENLSNYDKTEKMKNTKKWDHRKNVLKKPRIKRSLLDNIKSKFNHHNDINLNNLKSSFKSLPDPDSLFPSWDLKKLEIENKFRRFRREAMAEKSDSSWENDDFFNAISKDSHQKGQDSDDDLMAMKLDNEIMKTINYHVLGDQENTADDGKSILNKMNGILRIYRPSSEAGTQIIYKKELSDDEKKSYYDYIRAFVSKVSHSFGELMKNSYSYINGWWKVFN